MGSRRRAVTPRGRSSELSRAPIGRPTCPVGARPNNRFQVRADHPLFSVMRRDEHVAAAQAGCPSGQWERTVNPSALPSKVRILDLPHWGNAPVTSTNTGHRGVSRSRSLTAVHGTVPERSQAAIPGVPPLTRVTRSSPCPSRHPRGRRPPGPSGFLARCPWRASVPTRARRPTVGETRVTFPSLLRCSEGVPGPVRCCFPDSADRGSIAFGTRADNADVRSPVRGVASAPRARVGADLRFRCRSRRAGAGSPSRLRGWRVVCPLRRSGSVLARRRPFGRVERKESQCGHSRSVRKEWSRQSGQNASRVSALTKTGGRMMIAPVHRDTGATSA